MTRCIEPCENRCVGHRQSRRRRARSLARPTRRRRVAPNAAQSGTNQFCDETDGRIVGGRKTTASSLLLRLQRVRIVVDDGANLENIANTVAARRVVTIAKQNGSSSLGRRSARCCAKNEAPSRPFEKERIKLTMARAMSLSFSLAHQNKIECGAAATRPSLSRPAHRSAKRHALVKQRRHAAAKRLPR